MRSKHITQPHYALVCSEPRLGLRSIQVRSSLDDLLRLPAPGRDARIVRVPGDKVWTDEELWAFVEYADEHGTSIPLPA